MMQRRNWIQHRNCGESNQSDEHVGNVLIAFDQKC